MIGRGRRRPLALAATAALAVVGCLTDAPVATPSPSPTVEPVATPIVTTYRLDRTVWYGGFVITFRTATATIDAKGGPVAIDLIIGNPGDDAAALEGPITLVSGEVVVAPDRESTLPLVESRTLAAVTMTFDVDVDFDVPGALVRVGRPDEHQASIPLTGDPAATVVLKPQVLEIDVASQAGSLLVRLTGVELRADLPDWRLELDRSLLALTLTYDATFRSEFSGGFPFTGANVALRLPDGTTVESRRDGHSQSVLVISPGDREAGLRSRFEVPVPGPGAYALVIRDGSATKDLPFEIPAPADPE